MAVRNARLGIAAALLALAVAGTARADEVYLDLGVGGTYFDGVNRDHHGTTIREFTEAGGRLEATAYRRLNTTWDLGAGVLFDWIGEGPSNGSRSRLGFRVVELKQHWTGSLASRYFFTVNRMYRRIPAFGYGFGAGLEAAVPGTDRYHLAADVEHTRLDAEREAPLASRNFTRLWIVSLTLKRRF